MRGTLTAARRFAIATLGIVAAACSAPPGPAGGAAHEPPEGRLPPEIMEGTPVNGGTLTVLLPTEPPHLNLLIASDGGSSRMTFGHVYEGLLNYDPNDETGVRYVPALGESVAVSPDGLTFTFALRRGVTWHDGAPFTADDVIFTFDLVRDAKNHSSYRPSLLDLDTCERVDEYTVRFRFKKPYFKSIDALGTLPILPRHVFERGELATHPNNRSPIGTGPFRFVSWEQGSKRVVYERNDAYWGPRAHVDRLVFRMVEDRTVAAQLVARGEIDHYFYYLPEQWVRLADDPAFLATHWLIRGYTGSTVFVAWNEKRPFFVDRRVRGALARLVNRPYLADRLERGLYVQHECVLDFREADCDPDLKPPPFDPAAARALLDEAGWVDHDGDGIRDKDGRAFRFDYMFPSGSALAEQAGILLRDELRRSGIRMDLQLLEWATFLSRMGHAEFDAIALSFSSSPRTDPYSLWHSTEAAPAGLNVVSFNNAEADRLLEAGRLELDDDKRHAIYRAFGRILDAEQPRLFLGSPPYLGALSKRVRGANNAVNPYMSPHYAAWWLVPGAP